ncbi:hypothetical protein ACFP9V_06425 [Deinococcus radiopugnans]|uniref:DUF2178 domain-containing protein n=1 Tax=Deinococcus radiopugnans ATCC 19172 TaxID=585398 RepID=A0A5C4Y508_9DEIO|nr:hypothetical protein [Deinococcus radiopugnans]MBB6017377.1 hypothetical protein [Deinococcus radiopugnans ATCC 19172]TNM70121.1 hypothetical protein FHR04_14155 [Deinococcus radiopugnans ATCC 19172]
MPYREKIAWLSLVAMTVTFGPYFALVQLGLVPAGPPPYTRQLLLYAGVVAAQLLILGLGHLWLRRQASQEARLPPDERDRAIGQRSVGAAYSVMIGGMIVVGCLLPFSASGWGIVNAALFMIVVAEMVRSALVVHGYRAQT